MKWILLTVLALLASPCWAQTVYKCKDKNGAPIFAQRPCASDPAKVETLEVRGNGKEDPAAAAAALRSEAEGATTRRIRDAEDSCLNNRLSGINSTSDSRVRGYQSRISQLEYQMAHARNNLAGATWESGIRSEIAALRTSISEERTSASRLASDARSSCAEERRRAEDRAREDAKNATANH